MATSYEKLRSIKCMMTEDVYIDLVKKVRSEGWTIQEAIYKLICFYIDGRFDIKDN